MTLTVYYWIPDPSMFSYRVAGSSIYTCVPLVIFHHNEKEKSNKDYFEARHLRVAAFACVCSGPGVCVSAGAISSATASSYTSRRVARIRPVELQLDYVIDPEGGFPTEISHVPYASEN